MKSPLKLTFGLALAVAIFANPGSAAVIIDYVTVGNAGNAADTTTFGSVSYDYRIGKNEVTVADYVTFLNAVADTDTYGLYNTTMGSSSASGGITRTGSSGSYTYAAVPAKQNMPVTFVSWFDAARFTNWIANGQPTGGQVGGVTETGTYTLTGGINSGVGVSKNPGSTVWIPTENEWYKAAYYDPNKGGLGVGGYWSAATQSNTISSNTVGDAGAANYNDESPPFPAIRLTDVGAFGTNSDSFYGTNDQSGNVWELTDGITGANRIARGGSWLATNASLYKGVIQSTSPTGDNQATGFRLASSVVVVPEPSTALFSILALGTTLLRRNRRSN